MHIIKVPLEARQGRINEYRVLSMLRMHCREAEYAGSLVLISGWAGSETLDLRDKRAGHSAIVTEPGDERFVCFMMGVASRDSVWRNLGITLLVFV
jgi:hypothetical protein